MSDEKEYFNDFQKIPGITVLPLAIWAVVIGLAIGAALYPAISRAEGATYSYTFPNGTNKITLFSESCPLGDWFNGWKRAQYFWNGQVVAACWRLQRAPAGQSVYTIDAQGEIGDYPVQAFKKDEGV